MPFFNQEEETCTPEGVAALQRRKLTSMLRAILPGNHFYAQKYAHLLDDLLHRDTISIDALPFTTRAELERDQAEHPPFGHKLSFPISAYTRFHQTSGSGGVPLRWLDRAEDWAWWRKLWGTIYRAAGISSNDRFVFPFSFGPFIGFWAAFESAVAMGHLCLPAGGMTTKARLQYALENEATVVCCTPTYALHMADVAEAEGIDLAGSRVHALIVAGEPGGSIAPTRRRIESAWGARVFDHAGMTEVGAYAFECAERAGGMHVTESEFIAEIIDPATLAPAAGGDAGELVLTNLGRWGAPLIRYRTGDLVRPVRETCACGRSFLRLDGGIIGRIDDMVTIRGNNVFPAAIEAILREFKDVAEYRVEVNDAGAMNELCIEIEAAVTANGRALCDRVADAVRDRLSFRPVVTLAEPGSLPRYELKSRRWRRRSRMVAGME